MRVVKFFRIPVLLVVTLNCPSEAFPNDSAAELSIGGLRFTRTNEITMDSEELRISIDRINVRYQFTNISGKPVTLTVAFPLPEIDLSEAENIALPSNDPVNFVDFETKVDGVPAKFSINQRAFVGDKDVSSILSRFKLPLLPIGSREVRVQDLPASTRDELVSDGLLSPAGTSDSGRTNYSFAWIVKTSAVRQQTFPFDHAVSVEHRYRPSVGSSADTILRKPLRQNKALAAEIGRYRTEFCISDSFLAAVDKLARVDTSKSNIQELTVNPSKFAIQERRIAYILNTGANWAGPIKNFKLTIDPGAGDRLVSFCAGGLKATPTNTMEFTATDFKPNADLKILFVGRF
jgi:Domain of unknown function (DUF4424)